MVNIKVISLWFLLAISLRVNAQQSIDNFLTDVLSVNDFKLNISLSDLKKNGNTKDHFFVFEKEDNSALVQLKKSSINLLGLQSIEMVNLIFKDDKLNYIDFDVLGDPANGIYEKVFENFKARYGVPLISSVENNQLKKYTWTTRSNKLMLRPNMNRSFSIVFAKNVPEQKPLWIYTNRSGHGQGLLQLNLAYFEKLVNSNLTISAFEKYLPSWTTEGVLNHVEYKFNHKTKQMDGTPFYRMSYKFIGYNIEIRTDDTVSKIIEDYKINNINNPQIIVKFKDDIRKMNYQIDPSVTTDKYHFYINQQKNVAAILDEQDGFSIHIGKD